MSLFDSEKTKNLLPIDGELFYYGKVYDDHTSFELYKRLLNEVDWKPDEAIIFGKHLYTKRKVAWYGDVKFRYTYSKIEKEALIWTPLLREIRDHVCELTRANYNACLLNLYHSGEEGMAYHSDDEKDLVRNASIASLSFGAERKFSFKHKKNKDTISLQLESGSLLEMAGETQTYWLHRLPPTKKVFTPRINLTFRLMDQKIHANLHPSTQR